jgi:hypothetical protein
MDATRLEGRLARNNRNDGRSVMSSCNPCNVSSINNQAINQIPVTPPIPCPPCVGQLEEQLLVLINVLQGEINLINEGASDNVLANWLFNA